MTTIDQAKQDAREIRQELESVSKLVEELAKRVLSDDVITYDETGKWGLFLVHLKVSLANRKHRIDVGAESIRDDYDSQMSLATCLSHKQGLRREKELALQPFSELQKWLQELMAATEQVLSDFRELWASFHNCLSEDDGVEED